MTDAPVVIAGAGPVGLGLAVGLAHHGVRTVVLEESEALSRHSKAPGVLPRTMEIFAAWGIADRFLDRGVLLTRPRFWAPGRTEPLFTLDLSLLGQMTRTPGIAIIPQSRTEELLLDAARASGLADVRFGQRLTAFDQDESGVTVTAQTGEGETRLRTEYLVGCDGAHSAVRTGLGWNLEGKTYPARLLLADVRVTDARDALPWPRVTAPGGGILAGLRIEPGLWRLIASIEKRLTDEMATTPAHIAGLAETLLGPGPFALEWASVFRIHCRTSPHFRRGRTFLAGDAAHINSPAGGQGMNSGIQDAHNLSWKLARALASGPTEPLLASYEAERRPAIVTNVDRYTDLLTRGILLAPTPVRLAVLSAARLVMRGGAPPARVLRRAAMLDTRYEASPLVSGRGALLGARAPDSRVKREGAPLRLHDLVTRDAALLLFHDGRLPGWTVAEVETCVAGIAGLRVVRLVRRTDGARPDELRAGRGDPVAGGGDLVDAFGEVWADWAPRSGTAALVRPDGHVGWMAERPTPDELAAGVRRALGLA